MFAMPLVLDWTAAALLFAIIVPGMVLLIPIIAIVTHHRRQMAQMRIETVQRQNPELRAELAALRAEIHALRDTTTQYDLSFDTALQHMERRLSAVERKSVGQTEEPQAQINRQY